MAVPLLAQICAEIDGRLAALSPAVEEYERLLSASDALEREAAHARAAKAERTAASASALPAPAKRRRPRGSAARATSNPQGPAEQAIVAALEHGSHTVAELGVVTAMSGPEIRASLRVLARAGKIVRTARDGRAAYALSSPEA